VKEREDEEWMIDNKAKIKLNNIAAAKCLLLQGQVTCQSSAGIA